MNITLISWFVTGAVTGMAGPAIAYAACHRRWPYPNVPALASAASFVVLHGAISISLIFVTTPGTWLLIHIVLLAGSVLYWLPLRDLDGAGRFLYLFISSPMLDLAGVAVVGLGHPADGLAMIVGMLPLNGISVAVAWHWINSDESADRAVEPRERTDP